jgi:hypothetical protein
MSLKPNQSAITQIEVTMREVARVYDLAGGNALATGAGGAAELLTLQPNFSVFQKQPFHFLNDDGEKVPRPGKLNAPAGVYRVVRQSGYAPFLRTFARAESKPIDQKYVYIWSANSATGSVAELEFELYFEDGSFRIVPFSSSANQGKDIRKPEGERKQRLLLDVVSFWSGAQEQEAYYFYLTPFQLPWKALADPQKRIPLRAMRLWDWFYTDVYTDGKPESAAPLNKVLKNGKLPATAMFAMHLIDPFQEAMIRSNRMRTRLSSWMEEVDRLSKDNTYRLAKRIDNFSRGNSAFQDCITYSLTTEILTTEEDSARLRYASEIACGDLVRWIGLEMQNDVLGSHGKTFATLFEDGSGQASTLQGEVFPKDWYAPFSEAIDDYDSLADSNSTAWEELNKLIYYIHCGTEQLSAGKDYLSDTFKQFIVEGKKPLAHGGQSILFAGGRKTHATVLNFQLGLLQFQAANWVKKYRKEALSNLEGWIRRTHGVELHTINSRAGAKAIRARERRALKKARKTGEVPILVPKPSMRLTMAKEGLELASIGIEAVNLCYAYEELTGNPGFQSGINAAGALLDAYAAVQSTARMAGFNPWDPKFRVYGTKSLRFSPLAVASAGIDVVTAGMDTAASRTADEKFAHALRTTGAAMTLGGTVFAETGVGVVVAVAGLGLQSLGTFVVANLSAASKFLRYSKWGKGPGILDFGDERDEYWYRGSLRRLTGDIAAQHRALDNLYYDYQLELKTRWETGSVMGSWTSLEGRIVAPDDSPLALSGSDAKWTIRAQAIRREQSIMPIVERAYPDEFVDDFEITIGEPFLIGVFPWKVDNPAERSKLAEGSIEVSVRAKLDFFGDGQTIIERELTETFNLSFRPPGFD